MHIPKRLKLPNLLKQETACALQALELVLAVAATAGPDSESELDRRQHAMALLMRCVSAS